MRGRSGWRRRASTSSTQPRTSSCGISRGRIRCATIYYARHFREEATGPLASQGLLSPTPEAAILGATIAMLIQHLPAADASSAGFYARTLRDLLAAAWIRRGDANLTGGDTDRLWRAKEYMSGRPAGSVSVDDMASALAMSRSVLYELFRGFGGVIAYDRLRRLRALYQDLCDATERRLIAELGTAHGFLDKTSLSRSFRNTFGCSMNEVRLGSRRNPASPNA